jgi:hypothetical protein
MGINKKCRKGYLCVMEAINDRLIIKKAAPAYRKSLLYFINHKMNSLFGH